MSEFKPEPSPHLITAMHHSKFVRIIVLGFKKFRFNSAGDDIEKKTDMDILDFLIAMNLLTR